MRAARPAEGARLQSLSRASLFFVLFLATALNSLAGQALRSVDELGIIGALTSLFGISAVLWVALAAGLKILRDCGDEAPLRRGDPLVAVAAGLSALLPFATAAMAGLTLVSLWAIASAGPGSALRRSGIVFLAMSGALVWGRLFLAVFSGPLLAADAVFVSALIGSEHLGNMIWYDGASTRLVVAPGCSSMQGISLALLFWATINQFFAVRFDRRAALCCLAALAATIAINVLRIGAMLLFPARLEEIHHGWGFQLSMWLSLAAVAAICLYGARHDVFRRI